MKGQGKIFFQINRSTDRTNRLFLSWLSRRSFSFADLWQLNTRQNRYITRAWASAGRREDGAARRWWTSCFGAINVPVTRMVAHPARWGRGGLKILPHGPPKTWGEPCGTRYERCCGVMTAAPAETCCVPIVRGRGKYDE